MSKKTRRGRSFWVIATGFLSSYGIGISMSYTAETMRCQVFPDGDLQDVPIVGDRMSRGFVARLRWDENGLGYAVCGGKDLYFVAKTGRFIQAFNYDNGPDYFSKKEGLARYIGENGLIGFIDKNLNIVLPARYSTAFPFEDGLARVSFSDGMSVIDGWVNINGQVVAP
jgi:hypothetical protein